MEAILQDFIGDIGGLAPWAAYLTFFISAILQSTVPPYPGDTILVFGGYLGSEGLFGGEIPIFLSYWIGTILSSWGLYEFGVLKGERILKSRMILKYFPGSKQEKAKRWLLKYRIIMLFICKFIPGLNFIVIILGGILGFKKIWAYLGVGIASVIHNTLFLMAGRSIGDNMDNIANFLTLYNKWAFGLAFVLLAIYCTWRILKWKRLRDVQRS